MMRETLKLGAILGLVCAIAGASLAVVHGITQDMILVRQEQELNRKLQALIPAAERFERIEPEEGGMFYLGYSGNNVAGAIMEGTAKGYKGDIRLLVAIDSSSKISGVEVVTHGETIGIGTRALEPGFLQQFSGRAHDEQLVAGKNVDMITGATVSSRAVLSSVGDALALYKTHVLKVDSDDTWDLAKVKDGVYEGVAPGFKSDIKVKVTVQGGKITDVEVVTIDDTPEVYPDAVKNIPPRILEKQHWNVDAVSGATLSSNGIMEAVRAAIPDMSLKFDKIADGTYEGIGQGFGGDLKVRVEVANGAVTKISVVSHGETDYVSDPAFEKIPGLIIEKQSVKVDAVSGATYTSNGLIEAITKALEAAPER